jgi:hypothetical protein
MFPTSTKPISVLSWAAAAFFVFAAFRVVYTFIFAYSLTPDLWQRHWTEFGILAGIGLVLYLTAYLLSRKDVSSE